MVSKIKTHVRMINKAKNQAIIIRTVPTESGQFLAYTRGVIESQYGSNRENANQKSTEKGRIQWVVASHKLT